MNNVIQALETHIQTILPNWSVRVGMELENMDANSVLIEDTYNIEVVSDTGFSVSLGITGYGKKREDVENAMVEILNKTHKKVVGGAMVYIKTARLDRSNNFWGFSIQVS
ncbi:MAG: hypothetical protein ABDH28_06575, partial [Brevinematia bacterium]